MGWRVADIGDVLKSCDGGYLVDWHTERAWRLWHGRYDREPLNTGALSHLAQSMSGTDGIEVSEPGLQHGSLTEARLKRIIFLMKLGMRDGHWPPDSSAG